MEYPAEIQNLIDKVKSGDDLSIDEEFTYLTKVLLVSESEANLIIARSENKNPNLIID